MRTSDWYFLLFLFSFPLLACITIVGSLWALSVSSNLSKLVQVIGALITVKVFFDTYRLWKNKENKRIGE